MKFNRQNVTQDEMGEFAQKIIAAISLFPWKIESVTEYPPSDVTVEIEDIGSFSICDTGKDFCLYKYVDGPGVPFGLQPSVTSQNLTELISAVYNILARKAREYTNPYLRPMGLS